jgi:hypothetical protein
LKAEFKLLFFHAANINALTFSGFAPGSQPFAGILGTRGIWAFFTINSAWRYKHVFIKKTIFHNQANELPYSTRYPNGVSARPASLKCCRANGIPIIVMASKTPNIKCVAAIQIPPIRIQIIFIIVVRQPPFEGLGTTLWLKGHKASRPSLMVCKPNGIPMIVTINKTLATKYSIAVIIPPKTSQIRFPKSDIKRVFVKKQILFETQTLLVSLTETKSKKYFTLSGITSFLVRKQERLRRYKTNPEKRYQSDI